MLFITFNNIEDENEFYYVYKKYNRLIYKYISDVLNNHQDCEDAIQKTWFKISVNIGKIKYVNEKMKVGYIHRVAKNTAIDYARAKNVYNIETDEIYLKNSYNDVYKFIELADFKEAILSLSDEYRNIVMLKYAYGYSIKEISEELNLTETNVGTILYRAKKLIKKYIEDIGD